MVVAAGKVRVIVTLRKDVVDRLREIAKREERSLSQVAARLIRKALGV